MNSLCLGSDTALSDHKIIIKDTGTPVIYQVVLRAFRFVLMGGLQIGKICLVENLRVDFMLKQFTLRESELK